MGTYVWWNEWRHRNNAQFSGGGAGGFSDFFSMLFGDQDLFGGTQFTSSQGRGSARQSYGGYAQRHATETYQATITIGLEEAIKGTEKGLSVDVSGQGTKSLKVKIPAGTANGSVIRLAKKPGSSLPGDILLTINVAPHPKFRIENGNLIGTLPISPWEASLGAKVPYETFDGKLNLTVPPGSQSDSKLRLKGKGFPDKSGKAGDLLVELKIAIPKTLTKKEKQLLESLQKESKFDPRAQ
jgi:curved DNA-binding protein